MARILGETKEVLSPWVSLVSRKVEFQEGEAPQVYHSLSQNDYVAILGVTKDGRIPIVRQFRSAVNRMTWELPAGLVDQGKPADKMAAQELEEEAGCRLGNSELVFLGKLEPDVGRLQNQVWCYFAAGLEVLSDPQWVAEPGVERRLITSDELRRMIEIQEFDHAMHVAVIFLAVLKGCFKI